MVKKEKNEPEMHTLGKEIQNYHYVQGMWLFGKAGKSIIIFLEVTREFSKKTGLK